ncbi:DUF222 domain-containing protein [Specibacter sp. NPDC057265]|uniref:HNH endonuclease signature motif containing protein n=1 Tax=Specibacter sp. NPDC057265 TaxID=3346075 RepID=UPI00363C872B
MRTEAEQPVRPASFPGALDAGAHVHQLLHLAHALTRSSVASLADDPVHETAPVGVDVAGLTDQQCLRWARDLEHLLHYGQALAVQISGELGQRYAAGRFADSGARGQSGLLVQTLQLSTEEAARRLKLAAQVLPVMDTMTGAVADTAHPHLSKAFFTGAVSQDCASTVGRYLAEADRLAGNGRITADEHAMVESTLVDTAKDHGPDFIRRLAHRILGHLDPDGQKPSASDLAAKQGLFFRQPRRGLISFHGHLTIEQHEQLMAAIGHATNPNKHRNTATTEAGPESASGQGSHNGAGGGAGVMPGAADGDFAQHGFFDFPAEATSGGHPGGNGNCGAGPEPTPLPATNAPPLESREGLPGASGNNPGNGGAASGTEGPGEGRDWGGYTPDAGPGTAGTAPWTAKTVDGVRIPAPGSTETLPGLDPIDPNSTDMAVKDTRTHGQKLLDGLVSCLKLAARTGALPINGGLKAQLILSCTEEELRRAYQGSANISSAAATRAGTIQTAYNGPVPLHLFDTSLCDPEITRLVYSQGQTIINAGRSQRLFTAGQRKLLFARDLGCTFPDCTAPAPWTEAHHIIPWQAGGPTNLSNACLLCSYHHTLIHNSQWSASIDHGTPQFTPPWYLDPSQTPRANDYHHAHAPKVAVQCE